LTPPLTQEFLRCLDLTPCAEAVLDRLKSQISEHSLEETKHRQREVELKVRIANLKRYLGSEDPEKEETYWHLIKEAEAELQIVRQTPTVPRATVIDLERVRQFLDNLEDNWAKYPSRLRNHLLKLIVDRVELRHDRSQIEATIVWKMGLRQVVKIQRPRPHRTPENSWTAEEMKLLRMLWPSASWDAILAALPVRSKSSIRNMAVRLRLSRQGIKRLSEKSTRWMSAEVEQLKELYTVKGSSIMEIADRLERTREAVEAKIRALKLRRPRELWRYRKQPVWEAASFKVIEPMSSLPAIPGLSG
jgi:hypothetical protein